MTTRHVVTALLAVALMNHAAAGQSIPDLLQKGIYTQETVGDLDGAIRIYRQIINSAADSRAYAAQALYRLGLCLQAKGESAGAIQAFQRLIKDYPEEKDLAAKAHQYLPRLTLLPAPWPEREWAEYRFLVNGQEAGKLVFSVEPSLNAPQNIVIKLHNYSEGAWASAEVERETMRPVLIRTNHTGTDTRIEYQDRQVRWTAKGKPRTIAVDSGTFDFEEEMFLLRRLPLADGYKVKVPMLSPLGLPAEAEYSVTGIEDVEVPAGKFNCFVVQGMSSQKWYTTDAARTLVKVSQGALDFELTRLSTQGPPPTQYHNDAIGFSLVAPAGWVVQSQPGEKGGGGLVVLNDPEMQAFAAIWAIRCPGTASDSGEQFVKLEPSQIDAFLMGRPAKKERQRATEGEKDWKIRPESVHRYQIQGREALSAVADYTEDGQKRIECMSWVRSENTHMVIYAGGIDPANFDAFLRRFQPIVESVVLP